MGDSLRVEASATRRDAEHLTFLAGDHGEAHDGSRHPMNSIPREAFAPVGMNLVVGLHIRHRNHGDGPRQTSSNRSVDTSPQQTDQHGLGWRRPDCLGCPRGQCLRVDLSELTFD